MLTFDPVKYNEMQQTVASIYNGEVQTLLVDIYKVCKDSGEDNPVLTAPMNLLMKVQESFNGDVLTAVKKVMNNMGAFEEFASFVNNLQSATVNTTVDVGSIETKTYDVAGSL